MTEARDKILRSLLLSIVSGLFIQCAYCSEQQREPNAPESAQPIERVPVHPWRTELLDNMRCEDIEQTIRNFANFDDCQLADTSISGWDSSEACAEFQSRVVVRLMRVRRLLAYGRRHPEHVIRPLRQALRDSLLAWPAAFEKHQQDYAKGIHTYAKPDASMRAQKCCLAATYILAELQDHNALPLLAHQYREHRPWPPPVLPAPVPPAITSYAMHRLAATHPREGLSLEAVKALDEYLAMADCIAPAEQFTATVWNADYSESDPRFLSAEEEEQSLRGQTTITLPRYPNQFKDGSDMQTSNGIKSKKMDALFGKLDAFVSLAYRDVNLPQWQNTPSAAESPSSAEPNTSQTFSVSPTLELAELTRRFEEETVDPQLDARMAEAKRDWSALKANGHTRWGSQTWMKQRDYYRSLTTFDLAKECFSRSIFMNEMSIYNEPIAGFESLRMFHNGFAELFEREDMWKGVLYLLEHLSSRLTREADLKEIVTLSGHLDELRKLYILSPLRQQVRGREGIFLAANLRVLKKFKWYLDNHDTEHLSSGGSPGFFRQPCSVALVALMLAKRVNAEKYSRIEGEITAVRWPRRQRVDNLKGFISLVTASLEGFVTEKDIRELDEVLSQEAAPTIDGTTAQDLKAKGFPLMSNARRASYAQTAAQSTAEVVADLGNVMIMGYCFLGRGLANIYPLTELGYYRKRIMPNMKVIRLIEEGRNNSAKVSSLLRDAVRQCLADYDKDLKAWNQARSRGDDPAGTGDDDRYYNKYRKYECPQMEFQRIHHVAYMSLYILANIEQLDAELLAEWTQKEKPQLYHCPDMDLWLVDAYFRQTSQTASDAAKKHAALTDGLKIAGQRTIQSKWDQPWDVHDQMFRMAKINPADIKTIETLRIPPELPPSLDEKTKEEIVRNFLDHVSQSTARNCEEALRDPATFASMGRKHELIYTSAKECFRIEDLPKMYTLLNEGKHVDEWRFIVQLIGFVSNRGDRNSIDVLLKYLQRKDVWPDVRQDRMKSFDVGMGKILCLEWMGMIGGEYAEEILLKAVTLRGAEELTKEWLDFTEVAYPGGKERATASIRGRAAIGLVFCQSAKGIEIVERMYEEEKQRCIQNKQQYSAMFGGMVDAMANKAYIDEHGLQKRLELYGRGDYLDIISEYIERYSLW